MKHHQDILVDIFQMFTFLVDISYAKLLHEVKASFCNVLCTSQDFTNDYNHITQSVLLLTGKTRTWSLAAGSRGSELTKTDLSLSFAVSLIVLLKATNQDNVSVF